MNTNYRRRMAVRLHVCGIPQNEIAQALGTSPTTICRDLRHARVSGEYERVAAQSGEGARRGNFYAT